MTTTLNRGETLTFQHDDCIITLSVSDFGVVGADMTRAAFGITERGASYSHPITKEGAKQSKLRAAGRRIGRGM